MSRSVLASTVFVACALLGESGNFLAQQEDDFVTTEEISSLLAWENSSSKLETFSRALSPLFSSLPKNSYGRLEPAAVRYALHRYFAQEHGWHFHGLDQASASLNSSETLSQVMKDRVPEYIEGLLERSFHGQGLGLKEVAMFAAALSDLVHRETAQDLEELFSVWELPQTGRVKVRDARQILKAFMMTAVRGHNRKGSSVQHYKKLEQELREVCFTWNDAQMWLEDLRNGADVMLQSQHNPFLLETSFSEVLDSANLVAHTFGKFQNMECHAMKDRLVEMEDGGTGRVQLNKFYSGVQDEEWPFFESIEYLRMLGALDESNPRAPTVIIPNYMGSLSFCANPSKYYSVCCMDECEGLLGHIERAVAQPFATPAQVASVVSHLESDTVPAPRNLSMLQFKRLDEIADVHAGQIPLHGRLFAQWMHHAYPRECRYPHVSGTTTPMTQQEFNEASKEESFEASDSEMYRWIQAADRYSSSELATMTDEAKAAAMPWSTTEELVAAHRHHMRNVHSTTTPKMLLLLAALMSASIPAWKASQKLRQLPGLQAGMRFEKQLV